MSDIIKIMDAAYDTEIWGSTDGGSSETGRRGMRAALRAAMDAGWKLVPVEPTEAMDDAARRTTDPWRTSEITPKPSDWRPKPIYRAMLAAAPDPLKGGAADPKIDAAPVPNLSDEERRDDK